MSLRERLTPKWNPPGSSVPGLGLVARAAGAGLGLTRRLSPALAHWIDGMQPRIRVAWGGLEFEVHRDGVRAAPRQGEGWGDNPRHNYVDRVDDRDARRAASELPQGGATDSGSPGAEAPVGSGASPAQSPGPSPAKPPAKPPGRPARKKAARPPGEADRRATLFATPDEGADRPPTPGGAALDRESLEADVARRMGKNPVPAAPAQAPEKRSAEELQAELARIRDVLQDLDDVRDFDLIKSLDGELYQLHRAVEYKMRTHKASEAKAELGKLFKM
ncbi:hypothetical protein L6R50_13595 [Myxococcota bacterium]|nr:hypothetical protein [Myxococcota bacterium]